LLDAHNDIYGIRKFAACYSSVPIFEPNETAKTGQVLSEVNLSPHYSICCRDALMPSNGTIE